MRFTGAAMVPIGDFLAHVGDWTGLPPAELLGLMRGASPVSAGASERARAADRGDRRGSARAAAARRPTTIPAQVLDELRVARRRRGRAVSGYLDLVGYRLLDGFDISEPYALELPDALLRAIRAAVDRRRRATTRTSRRRSPRSARKVPEEHRAEFDELLGEARLMYRIRDERGVFSDIWASGIMRRAALAAGRRVARRGPRSTTPSTSSTPASTR